MGLAPYFCHNYVFNLDKQVYHSHKYKEVNSLLEKLIKPNYNNYLSIKVTILRPDPVVCRLDSTNHVINHYPAVKYKTYYAIQRILMHSVDRFIHLSNNLGQAVGSIAYFDQ